MEVNELSQKLSKLCVLCLKEANAVCERCGDFYCTKKCQLRDWHRHRYICFPIPTLVHYQQFFGLDDDSADQHITPEIVVNNADVSILPNIPKVSPSINSTAALSSIETNKNSAIADKKPDATTNEKGKGKTINRENNITHLRVSSVSSKNYYVYLTSFLSTNRCLIREDSETSAKALIDITQEIKKWIVKLQKLSHVKAKAYALGMHNGEFHRVQVLSVKSMQSARVKFVDLGIKKILSINSMRIINSELLKPPFIAAEVQLKDVPYHVLSRDFTEFLLQFEGQRFIPNFGSNGHLDLLHVETKKSINDEICKFCNNKRMIKDGASENLPNDGRDKNKMNTQLDSHSIQNILQSQSGSSVENLKENLPELTEENKPNLAFSNHALPTAISDLTLLKDCNNSKTADKNEINIKEISKVIAVKCNQTPAGNVNQTPIQLNGPSESKEEHLLIPPFETFKLSTTNDNGLDVIIVEYASITEGIVGVFESIYAQEMINLKIALSNIKDPQPYRPVCAEYVIAKLSNEWLRAKITGIKKQEQSVIYYVFYIDTTKTGTVLEQDIRRYPKNLTMPCRTNVCLIEGYPYRLTVPQVSYLKNNFKGNTLLHVDAVKHTRGITLIECEDLIEELNKI